MCRLIITPLVISPKCFASTCRCTPPRHTVSLRCWNISLLVSRARLSAFDDSTPSNLPEPFGEKLLLMMPATPARFIHFASGAILPPFYTDIRVSFSQYGRVTAYRHRWAFLYRMSCAAHDTAERLIRFFVFHMSHAWPDISFSRLARRRTNIECWLGLSSLLRFDFDEVPAEWRAFLCFDDIWWTRFDDTRTTYHASTLRWSLSFTDLIYYRDLFSERRYYYARLYIRHLCQASSRTIYIGLFLLFTLH